MEEKERYEIHIYDDICVDLYDNGVLDKSINDTYKLEKLLNQQSKRIKELEEKILIQLNNNADNVNFMENQRRENQQLKQQLAEKENTITTLIEDSKTSKELLKKQLTEKETRTAELEEQLKNSIRPKFRTYQSIFYITKFYTSTKGNPEYDIISDKYYVAENENEIILGWNYAKDFNQRKYYYVRKDWVFATLEEAEQKLAKIGGKDD